MKITQTHPFQPITIVIESQDELDELVADFLAIKPQSRLLTNTTYKLREALVGKQKAIV